MLQRGVWSAVGLLALAVTASAQSLPANVQVVDRVDPEQKTLQIKQVVTQQQLVTKEIEVEINGQRQKQTITEAVPVQQEVLVTVSLKQMKAHTGDGKPLADKDLFARVKKGSVVVLGDERLLKAPFRGIFRDNVVLLVGPNTQPVPQPGVAPPGIAPPGIAPPPVPLPPNADVPPQVEGAPGQAPPPGKKSG